MNQNARILSPGRVTTRVAGVRCTGARVSGATCVGSGSERTEAGHTRKVWLQRMNLLGFSVSDFRFGLRYDWAMGIAMARLIRSDIRHISDAANNEDSFRVLRGQVSVLKIAPDARFMPYLELAGFASVALIRSSDLRFDLLSALVERWRPETHTFHFPCGECTVTLEDVAMQLGLPIDRSPVTRVSSFTDPAAVCYQLLGESPEDGDKYFFGIKFTWLKAKICGLSVTATEGELMCIARAYIMHMIGVVLMPDANGDSAHLSYLPLLADFSTARSYSWGSAVLATLYRELFRATEPQVKDIGGCLILLQSWALYQMSFLARISHQPYLYLLQLRWTTCPGIEKSSDVPIYRLRIEQHAREGFIWMPYRRPEITNVVPSSALVGSHIWCTNTPIINFNVVEWYHDDRVLRQFGCIQPIPDPSCQLGDDHGLTKRGRVQLD
ncbi:serine/threonine-protein phosphatase 7 long form homolog [Gossypium hirsutum]|uniref:Serine/threonine-protein phosphatase 7 long form homolog n=1 Tax=Gossypium hirsutum TaxID=3635 RepID=A0A1U8IXP2_GOSHI|nr:serine/threonine-protein phosphatase 7 long form homolog [Gossypium hirsutum]